MKIFNPNAKDTMMIIGDFIAVEDIHDDENSARATDFKMFCSSDERLEKRDYLDAYLVAIKDIDAYMTKAKYGVRAIEMVHQALAEHDANNENFEELARLPLIEKTMPNAAYKAALKDIPKHLVHVLPSLTLIFRILVLQGKALETLINNPDFLNNFGDEIAQIAEYHELTDNMVEKIASCENNTRALYHLIVRGHLTEGFEQADLSLLLAYARRGMIHDDLLDLDNAEEVIQWYHNADGQRTSTYYDYGEHTPRQLKDLHEVMIVSAIPFLSDKQIQRLLANDSLNQVNKLIDVYSTNLIHAFFPNAAISSNAVALIHTPILNALVKAGYATQVADVCLGTDSNHSLDVDLSLIKAGVISNRFLLSQNSKVLKALIDRGLKDDLFALVNHKNPEIRAAVLKQAPEFFSLLKNEDSEAVIKMLYEVADDDQKQALLDTHIASLKGHGSNIGLLRIVLVHTIDKDTTGKHFNTINRLFEQNQITCFKDSDLVVNKALKNPIYLPILINSPAFFESLVDAGVACRKFAYSINRLLAGKAIKKLAQQGNLSENFLDELKLLGKVNMNDTIETLAS